MTFDLSAEKSTDYEKKILANIEEFGCHIPYVFDPEGDEPGFAYSVGFPHTLGQGEVIAFGLAGEVMQFMINETWRQCKDDGVMLGDGLRLSGLLEGFDVVARRVKIGNIVREYLNSAMWHHMGRYGTPLEEVYQLVWPSYLDGLFPWDEGCAQDVIDLQPPLYDARTLN